MKIGEVLELDLGMGGKNLGIEVGWAVFDGGNDDEVW